MSIDYQAVYEGKADAYEKLVSAEDVDKNVIAHIRQAVELDGVTGLEVGVGTGRITRQLVSAGAHVLGVEPAAPMLAIAKRSTGSLGPGSATLSQAEGRALPFDDDAAAFGIAGWVFGHQRHWAPEGWKAAIGECIDEMIRVVRPGGTLLIFETLGTGSESPAAPNEQLAEYYAWLEEVRGFERTWLRTDYAFSSVQEAVETLGFFFGPRLVSLIEERQWRRVPECTGCWQRRND